MADYRLVLFDADATLFDYEAAAARALPALFAHVGLPFDREMDQARYGAANQRAWREFREGHISYNDIKIERFRRLFHDRKLDYEAISTTYLSYLLQYWLLMDGAEEVCRYLSSRCTIAIVTNGLPEIQKPRVRISPLSRYIPPERVFVGQEIGFTKPDPRIFEFAFRALGHTKREDALMVGDSLAEDIQGGINFGMDTCWVNPTGADAGEGPKATYTITSLRGLMNLV